MNEEYTPTERAVTVAAGGAGAVLAGVFGAWARFRGKPLHPDGGVREATLEREGSLVRTGVPWIDEPGTDDCLVRLSRATGVPAPLPDVHGLALRVPRADGGHGDVLVSTTGTGRLTRFLLVATRETTGAAHTTLVPYRTPTGPLLLAFFPRDEETFRLAHARPRGAWTPFATLHVKGEASTTGDEEIAFDPMTNRLPELEQYPWVAKLREGAYRASRRARHDDRTHP
ncbi:hypothetical protein [Aeromicrobium sp. IC_218]|uniref:hypothetical protein n=1 Tax=Aeromicrobium sp. IC_218 TaxID=2545468 RepID=UPI001039F509|nr:hypothetical protein [Aeromicrobium sp. IC_218]TCI97562.1 hypothetical protein E0W78_12280 [Aeromicrobium sp. IC_218]